MEFSFTEEQQMIRDTAEAFLAEVSTSAAVREAMATELGYDRELWQRVCSELYWPAMHIPEAYGGSGVGNLGGVAAAPEKTHGRPYTLELTLPPLAAVFLAPRRD